MAIEAKGLQVVRHTDADTHWEMVSRSPHPRLAGYVLGYTGYVERTRLVMRRREVPFAGVPVIISFGPSIRVAGASASPGWSQYRSFVAGLDDRFALTEYSGSQHGLQVNFTPLGAHRFFGVPMRAVANRVLPLHDVLGAATDPIASQLQEMPSWEERFALLDRLIGTRIEASRAPSARVAWAWRRIQAAGGNIDIGALTRELGCSRRHLIARFHEEIGLPPKLMARIQRFHRVRQLLDSRTDVSWVEIAYRCGYYDQAHFNRDFRQFAGCAPNELLRRRLPDGGGIGA
ncbi:MAG: helix-turn-helix domain-containing protein [Dongiaceae bacterium]